MKPSVYDNHEESGIDLMFDLENGVGITLFLDDEAAQELVDIIQNKLNARQG